MKRLIFLIISFVITITSVKVPNKPDSSKALIDVILKKINNIYSESLKNITSTNDDEFDNIETQLKKAAVPLGEKGEKYVKLIMRGIRSGKDRMKRINEIVNSNKVYEKTIKSERESEMFNADNSRKTVMDIIVNKIDNESLNKLNNFTNNKNEDIFNSIEHNLRKAASPLGDKGDAYVKNIMQRIRENNKNIDDGNETSGKSQNSMLKYIIEKVGKFSIDSLNRISSEAELENKLKSIETKLNIAAQPMGQKAKKYINIILRAIRQNYNNNLKWNKEMMSEEVDKIIENTNNLLNSIKFDKTNDMLRNRAVRDTAIDIKRLIIKYEKTGEDTKLLKEIKMKIIKRNTIISNDSDFRLLSDLLIDGINMALQQLNINRRYFKNNLRYFDASGKSQKSNQSSAIVFDKCSDIVPKTCARINTMKSLTCKSNQIVPLNKLCDGKIDCFDKSDEQYCSEQAIKKLHFAQNVLTSLDKPLGDGCFSNNFDSNMLSNQNQVLQDVLKSQLDFIGKYKSEHDSLASKANKTRNRVINEMATVISTLTMALDRALCSAGDYRRFNEILNEDNPWPTDSWNPKLCSCQNQCLNCTYPCKRICWHKISLSNWNCDSIDSTSMVSLNVICDGKTDCYDESDEKGCSDAANGKFTAHQIFNEIMDPLKLKASKDYKAERNKIWILIHALSDLEKLSLNPNPNPVLLKEHRNQCYELINMVYTELVKHTPDAYEAEKLYQFLLTVNQQLGEIIKRIGTGNKKIISDGCFCRSEKCAASYCTRKCQRACAVELKLTRYYCQSENKSIGINNICDGISDCHLEDDERNCNKEICRNHHLKVLQLKIEEVGAKKKGTAMGEVLSTWKAKVINTIKVAENFGKPTPRTIKDIVKDALRDLVLTYGSVEEYRRKDNNYALEEFTTIAQNVLNTVRSCGK